ncbi:TetR/AcrR family transcriptional regulator [Endozoicomonas euniceicola]|uniref:TetR/AcrR family transcriptional regulator n=1 Tax=Endozoicomonas euniceicola TaxID=1234143 RepID=A0ABY6H1W5_9GAMM|nr:TetR/AcrR family transcriptional regulator [Endozoicomonas euniceicola]UYM18223.1 TetR/AcrR family transcriptional regulator [Endozoicomonas euniceicola]
MSKTTVKPRKTPVQSRSKKRVESILEVTASLLVEKGYESLTAVGIAEKAKIPVASLYQYYPNKEAVIYALCESMINDVMQRFDDYENFESHKLGIWELLELIGEQEYANPANHKLEFELNRAMIAMPQLSELHDSFDERISKRFSSILKYYGSKWSIDELVNLSRIVFRMGTTYFEHINNNRENPTLAKQSKELIMKAMGSLIQDCLHEPATS